MNLTRVSEPGGDRGGGLPLGSRVRWDTRARLWADGAVVLGGSPWGVVRLGERARPFARRLRGAGDQGLIIGDEVERATADRLVARGIAHPVVDADAAVRREVAVIVPAFERTALLDACLAALSATRGEAGPAGTPDVEVIVVDDGSADPTAIRDVTARYGARVIRHERNRGPAAARNTGVASTDAPLIAFLDSDCQAPPGWLEGLVPHFADPRVGAVAPRLRARHDDDSALTRYEDVRSSLDMGSRTELVAPGGRLGFVPSAALVVRRAALPDRPFDPALRVGEDVDLVWRLIDDGWLVRYEPDVEVRHETRTSYVDWARRKYDYGTSAVHLDRRHADRLAPARVTALNIAALALMASGRPVVAATTAGVALVRLARRLRTAGVDDPVTIIGMAATVVGTGLSADAAAVGHLARREWWPVGWTALAAIGRSRTARAVAAAMLVPVAMDYVRTRPRIDPVRYALLRLVEDAAYGSGVIAQAGRHRRVAALRPRVLYPRPGKPRSR